MKKVDIIIVEDNEQFRTALKMYIQKGLSHRIIGEASNYSELMSLPSITKADIILMDLVLPDIDGFESTRQLLWNYPEIPVLALTLHYEQAYLIKLISYGFKGCVFKVNTYSELGNAIDCILGGGLYFPKEVIEHRDQD